MMFIRRGCPTIGFDESSWSGVVACCSGMSPLINLAGDVSRLVECRVVFCGNNGSCGDAVRFTPGDWPVVRSYIEGGGRLWMQAEFTPEIGTCLQDEATLTAFLAAMGSSLEYGGGAHDNNCASDGTRDSIVGVAGIAADAPQPTPFRMAATAEITGGVNVWKSPNGTNMVQVEQLGSGFLFLTGDSNLSGGCGYDNCAFFKRLWEFDDGDII